MIKIVKIGGALSRFAARNAAVNFQVCNYAMAGNLYREKLENMTKGDKVVLFMKGDREQPMCGFSNLAVKVLEIHGVPYQTYDVLKDANLRQGIKDFSDWPTIPQLYVNGKFVGGSDILLEMHQKGELVEFFKKEGLNSKLEEEEEGEKK